MQISSRHCQGYPSMPGTYDLTTHDPDGHEVQYTLRIPTDYDGQTALPVMLCLHFGGHAPDFYGRLFLELIPEPGCGALRALFVAPTTQAGTWATPSAEATALAALAEVERCLHVDSTRRVVMGYSMGGIGTWHFAATFRERFVAAIPIAGAPRQADLNALRDLPLYVIHSREDQIIPIANDEAAVQRLRSLGAPVEFVALTQGDHFDYRLVIAELGQAAAWLERVWEAP